MKEIYGGILLGTAFIAAIGAGFGGRSGSGSLGRAAMWDDLRGRESAPVVRSARFTSANAFPIASRSPSEMAEPVIAFAGEMTSRAADLSRRMSPEMGLPALITSAAAVFTGETPAREEAPDIGVPRAVFAAIDPFGGIEGAVAPGDVEARAPMRGQTAPFPIPRPSAAERAAMAAHEIQTGDGVIAAALGAVRSVGLAALSAEPAEAPLRRLHILPDEAESPAAPEIAYHDRRSLPGLNPGPPRDPFTDLRNLYRDRAPGEVG